jgi:hypothetical protein
MSGQNKHVTLTDVNAGNLYSGIDPTKSVKTGYKIPDVVKPVQKPQVQNLPQQQQPVDLGVAYELAKQLVDIMNRNSKVQGTVGQNDEPVIKELTFRIGQSFNALPILSSIDHPMLIGTSYARKIPIGSRAWLVCTDQMRTYGWPQHLIQKSFDLSAEIVKHDALYDCIEIEPITGKRINHVEKFCTYWPDPSRQRERIKRNTDKILNAIRSQYAPENPFRPQNYNEVTAGKEKPKAPPVAISFFDSEREWKDILRNFTIVRNKIKEISPVPTFGWECTFPKDQPWIPVEYRQQFEAKYGLVPYFYMPPIQWKRLMFTLMEAEKMITDDAVPQDSKLSKEYVQLDAKGRWSLTIPGVDKDTAFRVFLSDVEMDTVACPKITEGQLTLREWCDFMKNPASIYPLLHVILNVDVPSESAQFEKAKYYNQFIYLAYFNNNYYERIIADAPLKLFRDLLLRQYGGMNQGLTPAASQNYSDCFKRFSDNIWAAIQRSGLLPRDTSGNITITTMPDEWRNFLESLYSLGENEKKCYDPSKPLSNTNITLGVPSTKVLTREQISALSLEQRKLLAKENSITSLVYPGKIKM